MQAEKAGSRLVSVVCPFRSHTVTNYTVPTGALNKSAAAEVMGELVKLNREGTTILMVTHDSRIASSCDRIIYLLDGRIFAELTLGKSVDGAEKRREEKMSRWLVEMGW